MIQLLEFNGNGILLMILLLNAPGILGILIGIATIGKKPKLGKRLIIFGVVYLIVGWGACGILAMG